MPVSDLAMPQPPEAVVTVTALGVATAGQPRAVTCPSCDMPWFGGLEWLCSSSQDGKVKRSIKIKINFKKRGKKEKKNKSKYKIKFKKIKRK